MEGDAESKSGCEGLWGPSERTVIYSSSLNKVRLPATWSDHKLTPSSGKPMVAQCSYVRNG